MNCEICGRSESVHVYILDPEQHMTAMCTTCDQVFWVDPPLFVEEPYALLPSEAQQRYERYLPYKRARDGFRQTFDAALSCHRKNMDGDCTNNVTRYYFSSGDTLPLCTSCVTKHAGTRYACMSDAGCPMSVEYREQVYALMP
jgi:hypothetical protein